MQEPPITPLSNQRRSPKDGLSISKDRPETSQRAFRILLYSHDSWGLGHLRRSLTIAEHLAQRFPRAAILVVTGSPCATFFPIPAQVEIVKLPAITKDADGRYVPRKLPASLHFVLELRQRILLETFRAFAPDLVLVDHQVVGLNGEVLPILEEAKSRGAQTILGIRDIIDSPEAVAREWNTPDRRRALAELYDRVCVYGAPEVFDPRSEYPIPPELGDRLEFTGYVVRPNKPKSRRPVPSTRPQVLVTMGGGEDGAERIEAYLDCLALERPYWDSVIVGGPLLDARLARQLKRKGRLIGNVELHRSHGDLPRLLVESKAVVGMAGYNTCTEILQSGTRALFLPRFHPRREQVIRASRLERLGLASSLVAPHAYELRAALEDTLRAEPAERWTPPLDGTRRLAGVVEDLLSGVPRVTQTPRSLVS